MLSKAVHVVLHARLKSGNTALLIWYVALGWTAVVENLRTMHLAFHSVISSSRSWLLVLYWTAIEPMYAWRLTLITAYRLSRISPEQLELQKIYLNPLASLSEELSDDKIFFQKGTKKFFFHQKAFQTRMQIDVNIFFVAQVGLEICTKNTSFKNS